jgi:small ligand-binding sensory domain FIST
MSSSRDAARAAGAAAEEALRQAGLPRADAVLCFATADYFSEADVLLSALKSACGTEAVVGASGAGVLTGKAEVEGSPGLVVLALASEWTGFHPVLASDLEELRSWWGRNFREASGEASLFVCMADTYAVAPEHLLATLEESAPGLSVFGGGSMDDGSGERSFQLGPEGVMRGAVAGLVLSGVDVTVGVTQACSPLGEPQIITRAQGSVVEELGGRPAFEVMAEAVQETDPRRGVLAGLSCVDSQTFGPGEYVVRPITAYDPANNRFSLAAEVTEGQSIIFTQREPKAARADLERLLSGHSEATLGSPAPSFGLYFNCCSRGQSLYGQTGVDTALLRAYLGPVPLAGLFTGLELAPVAGRNRLQLFSGVLALVRPAA